MSPVGWFLAFPVAIVGVAAALRGVVEAALVGELLLVSVLSYLASGIPYLIAYRSFLKPEAARPHRPFAALLTHFVAQGSAASVVLVYLQSAGAAGNIALGRLMIGMFWAVVLSVLLQARSEFRRTSRQLVDAISEAHAAAEGYDRQIAETRLKLVEKVRDLLAQMLNLRSADQLPKASRSLRPILDTIRDREALPQAPDLSYLKIPASRVFGTAVSAPKAPFAVALAAIAAGPLATLQNLTLPLALNYLPLGLTIFVSLWLVGKYSDRKLVVAFVYAIAVTFSLVTATIIGQLFSVPSQSLYLVNLRTWLVTFAMGVLIGYYFEQLRLIQNLQSSREQLEWQVARSRQLLWAETFKLALSVHGDVQSRIVSSIANTDELNDVDLEHLKTECLEALDRGLEKEFSDFWDQTTRLWRGAVELSLNLAANAEKIMRADPVGNAATIEIVREAVLNAVRHGKATKIDVSISAMSDQADPVLTIEVRNDGESIKGDAAAGFGTEVLSQVATYWHLENIDAEVRLTAVVPFYLTVSPESKRGTDALV